MTIGKIMEPGKTYPFNSMEEYDKMFNRYNKDKLLSDARMAIAWGDPDGETRGYTSGEFINLIVRLKKFIETNVP
jgi:hypothetical protein